MGHRKRSAPRRGSLAFYPRGRASTVVPVIRNWPREGLQNPTFLGASGFKAGSTHVITADDREKTPNFGKPLFNSCTVLATPPITICGFRAYVKDGTGLEALTEVYSQNLPKELVRKVRITPHGDTALKNIEKRMTDVVEFRGLVSVSPRDANLPQKKPFLFEVGVGGGDIKVQFDYLKSQLGKQFKATDLFKPGTYVDTAGISKGHGFEGPVTRFGVKRKQAKARKSVRAVATLGPWHPAAVMYTVPRAGQMGFHHRLEYNKRVLLTGNGSEHPIAPAGGFPHFGIVKGDYVVLKGSLPGPPRGLVRLRYPIRPPTSKAIQPKVLEIRSVAR